MASLENSTTVDCVFCRIIKNEIPSTRVYEDQAILAFLDINPVAEGHTLVIPKGHYATLPDMPEELGCALLNALSRVGKAVMRAVGAGGFSCLQNNFPAAGQVVPHVHWHIIPRFTGDGLKPWPQRPCTEMEAMRLVAEAIRREIKYP